MQRQFVNGKIHRATVTDVHLDYEGSVSVDSKLLEAVNILPGEKVLIANLTNGARLESYAIAGKPGEVCLNGGAAKHGKKGDLIILMTFALLTEEEIKSHLPKVVRVNTENKIISVTPHPLASFPPEV